MTHVYFLVFQLLLLWVLSFFDLEGTALLRYRLLICGPFFSCTYQTKIQGGEMWDDGRDTYAGY